MQWNAVLRALAIASLAACGGGGGSDTTTGPSAGGGGNDVTVGNNFFSPANLSVATGATVTWSWAMGDVEHQIAFVDGAPGSAKQSSGTFQRTFGSAGTYSYFCTVHGQAMSGTITVGSGGSTGGTGGGGMGGGGGGYGNP
ncbi:MAG TPA: plastocyanin/azurin family copper-binding protein [Gemmatimonadales bacterium]|nr:plastocyanin/azurin family copper-binding protein [Gemmatimonadales bacterium]